MKKGFTLVELLVVISIIAVLSGVILPNIAKMRARGRDGVRIADISQMRLALEHYFTITGKYPIEITSSDLADTTRIITTVPVDPSTKESYEYFAVCSGDDDDKPNGFHLGAVLEEPNEQLNADDDADERGSDNCNGGSSEDFEGADTMGEQGQVYDFTE